MWFGNWSIQDLLVTESKRAQKAGACKVEFVGKQYELKPETVSDKLRSLLRRPLVNTYYVVFKFKVTSDTGHTHEVIIRTLPKSDTSGPVQVWCDCKDFMYRSAYELQKHGALYRSVKTDTKLGEAINTAPTRQSTSVLCKHSHAALQDLLSNFSYYLG
jgi:hypothetical protein